MRAMDLNGASYPIEQRNVVEQVGVGEGSHTEALAEPGTLVFRESEIRGSQRGYFPPQRAETSAGSRSSDGRSAEVLRSTR